MSGPSDLSAALVPVCRQLFGDPNPAVSNGKNVRWGNRGSFSVDVEKGTWYDNEAGEGGGVLDLVMRQQHVEKPDAVRWLVQHKHIPEAAPSAPQARARQVCAYDYPDADGVLLFQVVRLDPKGFSQRRPDDAGGWVYSLKGVERVPYRLPQLIEAVAARRTVYIVEGEKSADRLAALGLDATCSPGGANKWRPSYTPFFVGADVVILPDNDQPGRDHAQQVAEALHEVASVRIVALPDLPPKGDVCDWLDAGHTAEELSNIQTPAITDKPIDHIPANALPEVGEEYWKSLEKEKSANTVDAVISEFNQRYMVVNEVGKAVIYAPAYDAVLKRRRFDRITFEDLLKLYLNRLVQVGVDKEGNPTFKQVANVWLRHSERRQYIHGVVFDPSGREVQDGVLNLWEGYAVKPVPGDWTLLRNHIGRIICDGDRVRFSYLMGWMARMLQFPAEQGEVAVVLKGGEGTGKGTLAKALLHIIGHHGFAISNAKHLIGNFNGHLRDAIFLFADEAFFAGDKTHVGTLKSLITEPYLTVEAKFQNAVQTPNRLHVMMASNDEWVVPAALDARRFFVLVVSQNRANDHDYFAAIWEQMEAGGYTAMLHDLLALDLTTFNVRAVPVTAGLQEQRKLSLPIPEAWWHDCLARGYVFRSRLGLEDYFGRWYEDVTTEILFDSYSEFAAKRGERRPLSREYLGRFMLKQGCHASRPYNVAEGEHLTEEIDNYGGRRRVPKPIIKARSHGYAVGTLELARIAFCQTTSLTIAWEAIEDDDRLV
jgi:hypothetical protein